MSSGWDGELCLSSEATKEFDFLYENLVRYNRHFIKNLRTPGAVMMQGSGK